MGQKMFALQQNHVGIVAEIPAVSRAALGEAAMAHIVGQRKAVIARVTLEGYVGSLCVKISVCRDLFLLASI